MIYYEKIQFIAKNRTWLILNLDFILMINFEKEVWIGGETIYH
jgi:hypothetical protein